MITRWLPGLLLLVVASPAAGQWSVATIGDQGELYELRIGSYEQLFPEGADGVASENRVMALDTTDSRGITTRLLVPGTDGAERENRPSLIHDAGQLFILWASSESSSVSTLRLIDFANGGFGSPMEISGSAQDLKGPPRLALTRDSYGPEPAALRRTTIHLLWWEGRDAETRVYYTPIVLVEGQYLGWNPVLELSSFDLNPGLEESLDALELLHAVTIEPGADESSVVLALPQQQSGRLLTMEIRLLPAVLQNLADEIRAHIIGVGHIDAGPRGAATLAGGVRETIEGSGANLHPGVLGYLADQAETTLIGQIELDLEQLADGVAQSVIDAGASILGNPQRSMDRPCHRMSLGAEPGDTENALHQIDLCLASDRALPETEMFARHFLYLSEDGADVVVAWLDAEAQLLYRRSQDGDWTEPVAVTTGSSISLSQALALLERQVRLD